MIQSTTARSQRRHRLNSRCAVLVSLALLAAACSSSGDVASEAESEPNATVSTEAADSPSTTDATDAADENEVAEPEVSDSTDSSEPTEPAAASDPATVFPSLAPPTGAVMRVGLVNSEGSPGLDFPDIRMNMSAAFDYLNEHGGMGGRQLELVSCGVDGSPEKSQACAQEVTGKGVELVLLGLDLFPDYATYTAANVPVIGMVPILPGDYSADALFLTGGNATIMGAVAAAANDHFGASTVGIVSADNVGANASQAALTASLDVAGIEHFTVKGGDNETDAGYQGLMRQIANGDPDLIVSLYSDAGCIGTMRGRAALGIETPVIATSICADADVIDEVGDDALGWTFVATQTNQDTEEKLIMQDIVAPALGVAPEEVDPATLGLSGLAVVVVMSLAMYSNDLATTGEVTGASLYEYLGSTPSLEQWPTRDRVDCGSSDDYSAVCSFTFPFAEYVEDGGVLTVPGLEEVSSIDYLP